MAIITNIAFTDSKNTSIRVNFDDGSFYHQTVNSSLSPFKAMIDEWLLTNNVLAYVKPITLATKDINANRDYQYSHLEVPFTKDNGDVHVICASDKGRAEISGACVNILAAIHFGLPPSDITWTTDANVDVVFSQDEFLRLGMEVAQAYTAIHQAARAAKLAL